MRTLPAVCLTLFLFPAPLPAQQGTIAPGDNLVVQGVPKIPASLAEAVRRYTDSRTAALADWHPTRREMLITTRFGDTTQVHLVKFPGGARTQLTFFPDSIAASSFQPVHGNFLVFSKGTGGNERFQNYRYDLASGDVTLLTDGTSRNSLGVWSHAGARMAYTSTRRNGRDTDLYLIDPADMKSDRLFKEMKGGGWQVLDWSPDDKQILVAEYVSINESYRWVFDVATGKGTLLTPRGKGERVGYHGGRFRKDGKAVYVATDAASEFRRLARLDLDPPTLFVLTPNLKWDVEDFAPSPDGQRIAFITNEAGVGTLHLFDLDAAREIKLPPLPAGSVSKLKWHRGGRDLAFHLDSARAPRDVYSLDVTTWKVDRWTFSETGGLNTEHFAEPELISWKSFDGREISGFLYRPPARFQGKRPVIINIHGGPEGQFRPMFLGRLNYFLNELGIALLFPNVRGSSGYGKTFLDLDNGFKREDSYKDIGALLDWLQGRDDLDAGRVMVAGASYGGHMTLAVATYFPERIRCAVDVIGISNLATFLEHTESYRRDLRRAEYGDERDPKMRAFLERIAPLTNAEKIKKPLFIVQGQNDPRVPLSEAEQMVARLRKQGTPVWYLMARDEGHGFVKKRNADFQFYATVQFVQEYLLR
jgi:dipeptidyl aminopeptidase/acylaminoacyl peptidase